MTADGLRASVIVPTHGDWDELAECLRCLEMQTAAPDTFEVLVANNNPTPALPPELRLPANAGVVWEGRPGSYAARNAAAGRARGEILFFTDADCRPEPEWIAAGLAALDADPALGRIGGAIVLTARGPDWTVPELYDRIFNLRQPRYVARGYAATANLVVRRGVFERVGPFNAELLSSGDKEWNGRAGRLGVPITYSEKVQVRHPARDSLEALARKRSRVAGGRAALRRMGALRARLSRLRLLLPSPSSIVRILREPGLAPATRARLVGLAYRLQLAEFRARRELPGASAE